MVGCGKNKAIKCLKELDMETGIGLIQKHRQGLGKANIIYVRTFVPDEKQTSESSERKKVLFSFLYLQFVDRLESISNQAREKEKAM